MSGFDPAWLALREPWDAEARSPQIASELSRRLGDAPLRAIDLATGTGSNLRALAPRLAALQDWILVDDDPAVLAAIEPAMRRWPGVHPDSLRREGETLYLAASSGRIRIRALKLDLAGSLEALDFEGVRLVTASALLDLVAAPWLERLARRSHDARALLHFALSYDGRIELTPAEPGDARVRALVNLHQTRDKGFGAALGPEASRRAATCLESLGYRVARAPSEWRLDARAAALQARLIEGWHAAACELADPEERAALADWSKRRLTHVMARRSRILVGHEDLIAWLD